MHECKNERAIDIILSDLKEIKSDMKKLNEWKWKVTGFSTLLSSLLVGILSLIAKLF